MLFLAAASMCPREIHDNNQSLERFDPRGISIILEVEGSPSPDAGLDALLGTMAHHLTPHEAKTVHS
jgi:hypothetical protein